MASVKYGAIVTEIKGSLGGHCFKKQRGTSVMMVKSNGYSTSKQLSNKVLPFVAYIFQLWARIPSTCQQDWKDKAAELFFPNKFGDPVHITGRELFTKLNLQLGYGYLTECPDPDLTPFVEYYSIQGVLVQFSPNEVALSFLLNGTDEYYLDITAEVSTNILRAPTFITRELIKRVTASEFYIADITDEFFAMFPYVTSSYYIRFYVTIVNKYGFKGVTQVVDIYPADQSPAWVVSSIEIKDDGNDTMVQTNFFDMTGYLFDVRAILSTTNPPPNNYLLAKKMGFYSTSPSGQFEMYEKLAVEFPAIKAGDYVRLYLQLIKTGLPHTNIGVPKNIVGIVQAGVPTYTLDSLILADEGQDTNLYYTMANEDLYEFRILAARGTSSYPPFNITTATQIDTFTLAEGRVFIGDALYGAFGTPLQEGDYIRLYTVLLRGGVVQSPAQSITARVLGL